MASRTMSSDSTDSVFDNEDRSSADTDTTPSSELSPPDSPTSKSLTLTQTDDKRADARELAASLSLEEQVRHSPKCSSFQEKPYIDSIQVSLLTAADFWRSKSIPEKGIPAFKTSDGPNGARGAIFKAGTKVRNFSDCVSDKEF